MSAKFCYYVSPSAHIEGEGFRISVVYATEPGHYPTGTWPYNGEPGEKMPYFARTDEYAEAQRHVQQMNAELLGVTPREADLIIAESMGRRKGQASRKALAD